MQPVVIPDWNGVADAPYLVPASHREAEPGSAEDSAAARVCSHKCCVSTSRPPADMFLLANIVSMCQLGGLLQRETPLGLTLSD